MSIKNVHLGRCIMCSAILFTGGCGYDFFYYQPVSGKEAEH